MGEQYRKPDFRNAIVTFWGDEIYIKEGDDIYKSRAVGDYEGQTLSESYKLQEGTSDHLFARLNLGDISEEEFDKQNKIIKEESDKEDKRNKEKSDKEEYERLKKKFEVVKP